MLPRPPLAISLAEFSLPDASGPRAPIDWAAAAGFSAIQLDATAPGLRPRELDRSARRDLAAILRRAGLLFTGLDLWIPPEHLTDPSRAERAADAIVQAIGLAAELVRAGAGPPGPAVSVVLPAGVAPEVLTHIARSADRDGVRIADHAIAAAESKVAAGSGVQLGLDPAAYLLANLDPAAAAARAGSGLASARLSDASLIGRVVPGAPGGRLDILAYVASLSVAGYDRPLILDLRALPAPVAAARAVLADW